MVDGPLLMRWQAECIRRLLEGENAELALVIVNGGTQQPGKLRTLRRVGGQTLIFGLYRRCFVKPLSRARLSGSDLLDDIPSIVCNTTLKGKYSQYFSAEDVREIRGHNLDFVLRFGFNIIRGAILQCARYGVWSFHHDDEEKYRGGPPCFWEIYCGDPVTGAVLQRLTDRLDGGVVLKKGYFKTIDHSWAANVDSVYIETADWPAQVCTDIRLCNDRYLCDAPSHTSAPIFRNPNNLQMLIFLRILLANKLRRARTGFLRRSKWNVGIVREPIHTFLQPERRRDIEWLPAPARGTFLADPFGVRKDGVLHLLVEEFSYRNNRAVISWIKVGDGEAPTRPFPVISLPVHLSYPFTFEHEGETYCVPETRDVGEISLYKATSFPQLWEKEATLVRDIAGVDATLFQHDGRWWLLCGDAAHNASLKLYGWHAPSLLGPWAPHAANPLKTDIRSSRPAGTPFVHEGVLYRPAQNCSTAYGASVVLNQILRLTPTEFEEEVVCTVHADPAGPYPDGVHTLSGVGNITVLDGKRDIFVRIAFQRTVARRLSRVAAKVRRRHGESLGSGRHGVGY